MLISKSAALLVLLAGSSLLRAEETCSFRYNGPSDGCACDEVAFDREVESIQRLLETMAREEAADLVPEVGRTLRHWGINPCKTNFGNSPRYLALRDPDIYGCGVLCTQTPWSANGTAKASCDPASCGVNCEDCRNLLTAILENMKLKCFQPRPVQTYVAEGDDRAMETKGGNHNTVWLIPTIGSHAAFMAPKGVFLDVWSNSLFRRITSCRAEGDNVVFTLGPREGAPSDPFPLLDPGAQGGERAPLAGRWKKHYKEWRRAYCGNKSSAAAYKTYLGAVQFVSESYSPLAPGQDQTRAFAQVPPWVSEP